MSKTARAAQPLQEVSKFADLPRNAVTAARTLQQLDVGDLVQLHMWYTCVQAV